MLIIFYIMIICRAGPHLFLGGEFVFDFLLTDFSKKKNRNFCFR